MILDTAQVKLGIAQVMCKFRTKDTWSILSTRDDWCLGVLANLRDYRRWNRDCRDFEREKEREFWKNII